MDPVVVLTMFAAAISALFWTLMKEKDRQIEKLETDNEALEKKIEALTDVSGKNADALTRVAETQETSVAIHRQTLAVLDAIQRQPRSTVTVTDPMLPGEGQ